MVGEGDNTVGCYTPQKDANSFFDAVVNLIGLGYTINTFFDNNDYNSTSFGKKYRLPGSMLLWALVNVDCSLLDICKPNVSITPKLDYINNRGKNLNYQLILIVNTVFIGKLNDAIGPGNQKGISPYVVMSFIPQADYTRMRELEEYPPSFYFGIGEQMKAYIENMYLDLDKPGKPVKSGMENEYDVMNSTMNTLRMFPSFSSKYMNRFFTTSDVFKNESQSVNPDKQRCQRYMRIPTTADCKVT